MCARVCACVCVCVCGWWASEGDVCVCVCVRAGGSVVTLTAAASWNCSACDGELACLEPCAPSCQRRLSIEQSGPCAPFLTKMSPALKSAPVCDHAPRLRSSKLDGGGRGGTVAPESAARGALKDASVSEPARANPPSAAPATNWQPKSEPGLAHGVSNWAHRDRGSVQFQSQTAASGAASGGPKGCKSALSDTLHASIPPQTSTTGSLPGSHVGSTKWSSCAPSPTHSAWCVAVRWQWSLRKKTVPRPFERGQPPQLPKARR